MLSRVGQTACNITSNHLSFFLTITTRNMAPKPAVKKTVKAGTRIASKHSKLGSALKDLSNYATNLKGESEASRTRYQKRQAAKRGRGVGGLQATEGDAAGGHTCYYVEPAAIEPPLTARRWTEGELKVERDSLSLARLSWYAATLYDPETMAVKHPFTGSIEENIEAKQDTSALDILAFAAGLRELEGMVPKSTFSACGVTEGGDMGREHDVCPLALLAYAALEFPDHDTTHKSILH
ncbi:hypothetical protein C8R47DRAFT_428014 [Mycena vitilis]|nr:hypothetical protein C8R47DRAFT_428014 [Mycena vitilis]